MMPVMPLFPHHFLPDITVAADIHAVMSRIFSTPACLGKTLCYVQQQVMSRPIDVTPAAVRHAVFPRSPINEKSIPDWFHAFMGMICQISGSSFRYLPNSGTQPESYCRRRIMFYGLGVRPQIACFVMSRALMVLREHYRQWLKSRVSPGEMLYRQRRRDAQMFRQEWVTKVWIELESCQQSTAEKLILRQWLGQQRQQYPAKGHVVSLVPGRHLKSKEQAYGEYQ